MTTYCNVLAWALWYIARGMPVMPLHWPISFGPRLGEGRARCSCRDPECDDQGKHPLTRNGLNDASTDETTVRAWLRRWPKANIAIRTGVVFDALDCDTPEAFARIMAMAPTGEPLVGPVSETGRGFHLLVAPTGLRNATRFLDGCDWRGLGGYIVVPPSRHYSGTWYRWSETGPPCG